MEVLIGKLLILALDILFWVIIIQVIMSWLIAFNVVNISHPQARSFVMFIEKITAPIYKPLRKIIPSIGGIDISPIIIIFAISILKSLVAETFIY